MINIDIWGMNTQLDWKKLTKMIISYITDIKMFES